MREAGRGDFEKRKIVAILKIDGQVARGNDGRNPRSFRAVHEG